MADFIDKAAVESSGSESDGDAGGGSGEPATKKAKKAVVASSDSEEDEGEDDEQQIAKEMAGFVVSGDEEEEGDAEKAKASDKDSEEDSDQELDEEDNDLIRSNLGIENVRPSNRARISDSEDEEDVVAGERRNIAERIFRPPSDAEADSDGEDGEVREPSVARVPRPRRDSDSDSGSEQDAPFIVDGKGRAIRPSRRRRTAGATMSNAQLEEAREIFGVEFDFDEFLGEDGDEEEEDEEREDEDEYDEDGVPVPRRRKKTKQSLLGQMEPAELAEGFLGDADKRIQLEDRPERFQLRRVPINTDATDAELKAEAQWIYNYAFKPQTVSAQDTSLLFTLTDRGAEIRTKNMETGELNALPEFVKYKETEVITKMAATLKYIRVDLFEVPFIATYRKEYVEPELTQADLWKIYEWDEKWAQHYSRRVHVGKLFTRMNDWQKAVILGGLEPDHPDVVIPEDIRLITNADYDLVRAADTQEELADVSHYFDLHHGPHIPRMEEWERTVAAEKGEEVHEGLKRPVRKDPYHICLNAGLSGFVQKMGLRAADLAENFTEGYLAHEVESYGFDPEETAAAFLSEQFEEPDKVILGAKFMVAKEISREPKFRKYVRKAFFARAMISTKVTKKGRKEIDENHPIYTQKYLKNKPVRDIGQGRGEDNENQKRYNREEFLRLVEAEENGLVQLIIHGDYGAGVEKARTDLAVELMETGYFRKDAYSDAAKAWNQLRDETLEMAVNEMLVPLLAKELRARLVAEAKEAVLRTASAKLAQWVEQAPWQPPLTEDMNEEEEMDALAGARVLALSYSSNRDEAAFIAALDAQGNLVDHLRLCHLLKSKRSRIPQQKALKVADLQAFRAFVLKRRPHIVCLGAENLECIGLRDDLDEVLREISEERRSGPRIPVELVDNEMAHIFAGSKRAATEFGDLPWRLREAVSIGRRFQDPLAELCQLWASEEEALCLSYHPLQTMLAKDDLSWALQTQLIDAVNQVGVDINRCLTQPHRAGLLQFCCGLGPRKAAAILKILRQNEYLENRTRLVTLCKMGNKVFMNCAGFIRIDVSRFSEEQHNIFIELLDGTRIHPETYEWARKMAIDALELDEAEDTNNASAIEEIFREPDKLKELDLDAFADELQRQNFGNKLATLYDIKRELSDRFKDRREPFSLQSEYAARARDEEERLETDEATKVQNFWNNYFNLVTKETPATFNTGKLVLAKVLHVVYRRIDERARQEANPIRDDATGLWQCPFCSRGNFSEIASVWTHFDAECPGQAVGVKCKLENGLGGFLPTNLISDNPVNNPEDRVKVGQPIYCRVTEIRVKDMGIRLTSRSTDLADAAHNYRPPKDDFYDGAEEEADRKDEERAKALAQRSSYVKRVIAHPNFRNVSFKEAEKILERMDQGECVIRPSSKGANHLTVTWKICEGICAHIDVREEGKEKPFSLGSQLWIGDEEFEDLDEIVARFVQPMAAHARDIQAFKYFTDVQDKATVEERLKEEKARQASRIPYLLTASKALPGKFLLSYLPSTRPRHEYLTVLPEGLKYRKQIFPSLPALLRWFKVHYREPPPGPDAGRSPGDQSSYAASTRVDGSILRVPGTPGTGFLPAYGLSQPPQPPQPPSSNLIYPQSSGDAMGPPPARSRPSRWGPDPRDDRHSRRDARDARDGREGREGREGRDGRDRDRDRRSHPNDQPDNKDWRRDRR